RLESAHADHVHLLFADDGADIAKQADAVPCFDADIDRVDPRRCAPVDFDEAFAFVFSKDVMAISAVDGDAAGAGNVADDLVARNRATAARHGGKQVADTHH